MIENNFNDDIIELLTIATKSDIKLIIVEPQRLVQYLSEEELVLFRESDNSFKFETILNRSILMSPNFFVKNFCVKTFESKSFESKVFLVKNFMSNDFSVKNTVKFF